MRKVSLNRIVRLIAFPLLLATFDLRPADGLELIGEQVLFDPSKGLPQARIGFFANLTGPDEGGSLDIGNFQLLIRLTGPDAGSSATIVAVEENMSAQHPQVAPLSLAQVNSPVEVLAATINLGDPIALQDEAGLLQVVLAVAPSVRPGEVFRLDVIAEPGSSEFTAASDFQTLLPFTAVSGSLTIATGIDGDFDGDLDVDGADLLAWQRDSSLGNIAAWQENYGTPLAATALVIPEPSTIFYLVAACLILCNQVRITACSAHQHSGRECTKAVIGG